MGDECRPRGACEGGNIQPAYVIGQKERPSARSLSALAYPDTGNGRQCIQEGAGDRGSGRERGGQIVERKAEREGDQHGQKAKADDRPAPESHLSLA